ncbi:MAG TPA: alpha-E domain-containing protein [Stellaceae bacterium]
MLSRTADNLFWMGRYIERAENTARILDVSYRSSLLPQPVGGGASDGWRDALAIVGNPEAFAASIADAAGSGETRVVGEAELIRWLTLSPENPSSILSSVRAARENARALRATITTEMWESLNATWLEIREMDGRAVLLRGGGARDLLEWVKERANLFRGVALGTMMHDEALRFVQLGTLLERSDNTARLLHSKHALVVPDAAGVVGGVSGVGAADYYAWGAVLRAVSAFRAYHQIYHDVITPARVAELLILRPEMPRSLRFCLDRTARFLDDLAASRTLDCQRDAAELQARLRFGRFDDIMRGGLGAYLGDFMRRVAALGDAISRDFMLTS